MDARVKPGHDTVGVESDKRCPMAKLRETQYPCEKTQLAHRAMNHDQPKSNLTEEQVAEVERRLRDANPTFMTVDEVRERLYREKIRKQRELLREDKARITPETPIESLYDEKTGLPK